MKLDFLEVVCIYKELEIIYFKYINSKKDIQCKYKVLDKGNKRKRFVSCKKINRVLEDNVDNINYEDWMRVIKERNNLIVREKLREFFRDDNNLVVLINVVQISFRNYFVSKVILFFFKEVIYKRKQRIFIEVNCYLVLGFRFNKCNENKIYLEVKIYCFIF